MCKLYENHHDFDNSVIKMFIIMVDKFNNYLIMFASLFTYFIYLN